MSERQKPPFRADHVGSLLRPKALLDARVRKAAGEIDQAALTAIQHDAVRDVVKLQEDLGLKSITDGEYNRESWQVDFLLKIANVEMHQSQFTTAFHNEEGAETRRPATVRVVGKVSRPEPIFVDDFAFLKSVTGQTAKITIPSPSVVHFRGGRDAIDAKAYPDIEDFYTDLARVYAEEIADLAAAGCGYVQLDEVNMAYLCDPDLRRHSAKAGPRANYPRRTTFHRPSPNGKIGGRNRAHPEGHRRLRPSPPRRLADAGAGRL